MTIKKLVYLFIAMASAAMISVACSKEKKIGTDDVFGQWKLEDVSAISTKGETYGITVYLEFTSPDRFDIWQQLQEGRYRHYNGHGPWRNPCCPAIMLTASHGAHSTMLK